MSNHQMQEEFLKAKKNWIEKCDTVASAILAAFGKTTVTGVVCFDVSLRPSTNWFAALTVIMDKIGVRGNNNIAQNSFYGDIDKAFLLEHSYGIADYPEGIYHLDHSTLVFCVNPSKQTISAANKGPQLAMLIIQDTLSTAEAFSNFEHQSIEVTGEGGNWSLYHRKVSVDQHKFGIGTEIEALDPVESSTYMMLHSKETFGTADTRGEELAANLIKQSVSQTMLQYGSDDDRTIRASRQLAAFYMKERELEKAGTIYRTILIRDIRKYGIYHIVTLIALGNLCNSFENENPKKASALYCAVVRGLREALGQNHRATAFAATSYGRVLYAEGKYVDAEVSLEQALSVFREILEPERRRQDPIVQSLYRILTMTKYKLAEEAQRVGNNVTERAKLKEMDELAKEGGIAM